MKEGEINKELIIKKYPPHQQLSEIMVIRPILVVLLVFYHAFAIYGGAWTPIEGFSEIRAYWWLDWLSYAFMLEMFVFISGYIFGYQVRTKGKEKLNAKKLFLAKFKRLIVPCALFSLLYILLFDDITQPLGQTIYGLVNGVAHMWFLPMLFWCFILIWLIEVLKLKPRLVFPLSFLAALLSINGLPLQFSHSLYYFPFFYSGYTLQRYNVSLDKYYNSRATIVLVVVFIALFVAGSILSENLDDLFYNTDFYTQTIKFITRKFVNLLYSGAGVLMMFVVVGGALNKEKSNYPKWILEIGNLCFGVYLFQQFILQFLYYRTSSSYMFGEYWLPWIGFVTSLLCSLVFSWFFRQFKIGRILI